MVNHLVYLVVHIQDNQLGLANQNALELLIFQAIKYSIYLYLWLVYLVLKDPLINQP